MASAQYSSNTPDRSCSTAAVARQVLAQPLSPGRFDVGHRACLRVDVSLPARLDEADDAQVDPSHVGIRAVMVAHDDPGCRFKLGQGTLDLFGTHVRSLQRARDLGNEARLSESSVQK